MCDPSVHVLLNDGVCPESTRISKNGATVYPGWQVDAMGLRSRIVDIPVWELSPSGVASVTVRAQQCRDLAAGQRKLNVFKNQPIAALARQLLNLQLQSAPV